MVPVAAGDPAVVVAAEEDAVVTLRRSHHRTLSVKSPAIAAKDHATAIGS